MTSLEAIRTRCQVLLAVVGLMATAVAFPLQATEQAAWPSSLADGPTAMGRARVAADVRMRY